MFYQPEFIFHPLYLRKILFTCEKKITLPGLRLRPVYKVNTQLTSENLDFRMVLIIP